MAVHMQTIVCLIVMFLLETIVASPNPPAHASRDQLIQYYYNSMYTSKEICGFLLFAHNIIVSLRQLKRMKERLGLRRRKRRSSLRDVILNIQRHHENGYAGYGYKFMWLLLNIVSGLSVSQETVRVALKIVDPEGSQLRGRRRLRRRLYFNRGPNFLIHMDGYDKLKPYGIAIHGCIDGFSRKLLWLNAGHSNNNPKLIANSYLNYVKAIKGVPRCVRSDRGTENVVVKDLQIALRSFHDDDMSGYNSFSTGRSSANQRIERFWCSLNNSFTRFWRHLFEDMVDSGVLNLADPIHIESVRFCFLPIITSQLNQYLWIWNRHRIRKQTQETVISDIPHVMYNQPEIFDGCNCVYNLPCRIETIDRLINDYTEQYREFGCSELFLELIENILPLQRTDFMLDRTPSEARSLFTLIVRRLNEVCPM